MERPAWALAGIVVPERRPPAGPEQGSAAMSDSNQITVRGRVGTDPNVHVIGEGKRVTKFRLGSTRSYRDAAGEWREAGTEWFTVKVWGAQGQAVCDSLHRGMPVIVMGRLSSEEWSSEERTHHTNVITATAIGVDIKYGLVTFAKLTRQAPASTGEAGAGEVTGVPGAVEQPADTEAAEPEDELGDLEEPDEDTDPVLAGSVLGPDPWARSGS